VVLIHILLWWWGCVCVREVGLLDACTYVRARAGACARVCPRDARGGRGRTCHMCCIGSSIVKFWSTHTLTGNRPSPPAA
jgi:hypothetical protein